MSIEISAQGLPIDGAEQPTVDGWTFPVLAPATGERIGEVPDAGVPEVDAAVSAARRAVADWAADDVRRAEAMAAFRAAVSARGDELVALMAAETGVPVGLRADHLDGPLAASAEARSEEGVTAVITPATSPLAVALAEVGRELDVGSTVVLKPAPEASAAALALGRIALEVLPPGVLNVLTTRDVDVAIALTLHDGVDRVSLTGSSVVAERVRVTGEGAGKDVRLDVGAPVAVPIPDDADLPDAVTAAALAVAANAGQGCRLPSTLVVPAHRYDEALEVAVETMRSVAVGDPNDPATVCGPLRSRVARDRALRYLDLARSEGGEIALGGNALDRPGWWIAPTVVGGLAPDARSVREEILGPVLFVVASA